MTTLDALTGTGTYAKELGGTNAAPAAFVEATIATTPTVLDQEVMVLVGAEDSQLQAGPCRWEPRTGAQPWPRRGDPCLIVTGDQGHRAIVWWRPATPVALGIPRVTALPTSPPPVDGQEIVYVADAAKGILWHLKYNAGSASPYKWEWVGGSRLAVEGVGGRDWNTVETTSSTTYTTLTTAGPALTVPLAGEYDVEGQATASHSTTGNLAGILLWATGDGTPAWNTGDAVATVGAALTGSTIRASRPRTLAAGNTVELRYASSAAASAARFYNRGLYLRPVRVG